MSKKEKIIIFEKIANSYDRIVGPFNLNNIINYLPFNKKDNLIDLGGGTGRIAKDLVKYVNCCLIIDLSFEMIKQAKKVSTNFLLIQGQGASLPIRSSSINHIFMGDALHHMANQKKVLQECYRILTEKGLLIIYEFDRHYFWNFFLILFEKIAGFGSKFFSPKQLLETCEFINFKLKLLKKMKNSFLLIIEK